MMHACVRGVMMICKRLCRCVSRYARTQVRGRVCVQAGKAPAKDWGECVLTCEAIKVPQPHLPPTVLNLSATVESFCNDTARPEVGDFGGFGVSFTATDAVLFLFFCIPLNDIEQSALMGTGTENSALTDAARDADARSSTRWTRVRKVGH